AQGGGQAGGGGRGRAERREPGGGRGCPEGGRPAAGRPPGPGHARPGGGAGRAGLPARAGGAPQPRRRKDAPMTATPPRFACDAMLGYLARWLRAAGYDAFWQEGIDDAELVRLARREGRYLLSCDTGIFQYRLVR